MHGCIHMERKIKLDCVWRGKASLLTPATAHQLLAEAGITVQQFIDTMSAIEKYTDYDMGWFACSMLDSLREEESPC